MANWRHAGIEKKILRFTQIYSDLVRCTQMYSDLTGPWPEGKCRRKGGSGACFSREVSAVVWLLSIGFLVSLRAVFEGALATLFTPFYMYGTSGGEFAVRRRSLRYSPSWHA